MSKPYALELVRIQASLVAREFAVMIGAPS